MMENFKQLLESLSADYLQVADEIITLAEKTLGCKLNESIYIALTDHIHMAVRRIRDGIIIRNMVLQETHKFYEKEFFGRATGFGNYERAIQSQHARRRNRIHRVALD